MNTNGEKKNRLVPTLYSERRVQKFGECVREREEKKERKKRKNGSEENPCTRQADFGAVRLDLIRFYW